MLNISMINEPKPFKVIVAGGRDFNDYAFVERKLDHLFQNITDIQIVSGKAPGVDSLGEAYAEKRGLSVAEFAADWSRGKKAGPERNRKMCEYADALVAFWDGLSRGTANCIKTAKELGLSVKVIRIN